jgi:hypothetical protein
LENDEEGEQEMTGKDYTEFEAKFYPVSKEEYRKKLLSIKCLSFL